MDKNTAIIKATTPNGREKPVKGSEQSKGSM
jgi:hypothetical protein